MMFFLVRGDHVDKLLQCSCPVEAEKRNSMSQNLVKFTNNETKPNIWSNTLHSIEESFVIGVIRDRYRAEDEFDV